MFTAAMFTTTQYQVLRRIRRETPSIGGEVYQGGSKLEMLVGDILGDVRGKTVIDFGSGDGLEALDLARRGAAHVIGLDLNPSCLEIARWYANQAGLTDRVEFAAASDERADLVLSLDSFEHFADPAGILRSMHDLLRPNGVLVTCFGPTWFHPLGGHLFSVFPWAHLLFSEAALIRWRNDHRDDRPRSFSEAGLNRMTIRRFERLVATSDFDVELFEARPIRRVSRFHNRITREFFTSVVRARLRKRTNDTGVTATTRRS